ncbi:MAG: hypothetical protein ACMX3H_10395 [Sodalis sp. (in: enterobacteria)]|uniref:DUF7666 domain-containing protein n=1 Tax=Sodalis sp. (in: enterobacteria) TaxID=1898979 RepID=UPI0039E2B331
MTKIIAYKGFNADLTCRDYQFEIGKTYQHEGAVEVCGSGFHACEYPLDVFAYYEPANHRFAEVEVSGDIAHEAEGDKLASSTITIRKELSLHQMVDRAVEWIMNKTDKSAEQATNTGDWSVVTNTGRQSAATNTGFRSTATNTGDQSAATNTGIRSAATNAGYRSAATSTGYQSVATNAGNRSVATNTGYQSVATNTGEWSVATNAGDQSAADVSGIGSVAASLGAQGKAKAAEGSAIVLCYRNDEGDIIHIRASKVGDNGVKPDTWYVLNVNGEFEEAGD